MERTILDEINERIRQVFAQSPAADLEKNLRAMLTALFAIFPAVTAWAFNCRVPTLFLPNAA